MLTGSVSIDALLVATVVGAILSVFVLRLGRPRAEVAAGLRTLAAMRWREFSGLVAGALRNRGFAPVVAGDAAEQGQQGDVLLQRDGEQWLLSCKQGLQHRITRETVAEVVEAMRFHGAVGGVIATPGSIDAGARSAADRIELIDGATLWPLAAPLLPAGVLDELKQEAAQTTRRHLAAAWVVALAAGVAAAWLLRADPAPVPASAGTTVIAPSPTSTPADAARADDGPALRDPPPISDEERRSAVTRIISGLPGIDRAVWSTRSTLLVYLENDNGADRVREICAALEPHDELRASRVQLQPPAGSRNAVRFMQCRAF